MKIADVRVVVCSPGRNYVTVVVETEDGLIGVGDATLNGRELAVASYLRDHIAPLLIGRDASRIEDIWQYLYRGGYWRRGPVLMTALAGVDVALWDLLGKSAGLPLYKLLGGRCRDGVMIYGHANGHDLDSLSESFQEHLDQGYRAIRVQATVPGLEATYGISADRQVYEPAGGALPQEDRWETSRYLDFVPTMMAHIRDQFGFDVHLLHDVHHRLTPIEAARLGAAVEPYRLWWLEDPTPAEDQEAFRQIRAHTTTPLATGEVLTSIWDSQTLITQRLIDYIRSSVSHSGGITHLRRILQLAELYGVRSGCHGAGDLSPISFAAALHVDLSIPNFGIQEYMGHREPYQEVFRTSYDYADGYMHPGELPGLGVEFDEAAAARYPYSAKYLPVNRLTDGSVHDW